MQRVATLFFKKVIKISMIYY